MPIVAIVDGIRVVIFPNDHDPPHFHAILAEHMVKVDIARTTVIGRHGARVMERKILRWAEAHKSELLEAWTDVRSDRAPRRIT